MSLSKPEERLTLELSCPICLQLYRDPVALPCGHNYCLGCIQNAADAGDPKNPSCCPECREVYASPTTLPRNFKLSGIVDGYLAATSGGRLRADPLITCDQCLYKPVAAVKFCRCCEMSLCSGHLEWHKDHVLVEASAEQGGKRCPVHRKTTEYLCMKEQLFLCSDCLMEGTHQSHDVQTFEVAKGELKRVLEGLRKTVSDKLRMTEALLRNAIEREVSDKVEDKLVAKANILLENMSTLISVYKVR